jgi:hypothetical protein
MIAVYGRKPGAKAPVFAGFFRRAKALRSLLKAKTMAFSAAYEAEPLSKTGFFRYPVKPNP